MFVVVVMCGAGVVLTYRGLYGTVALSALFFWSQSPRTVLPYRYRWVTPTTGFYSCMEVLRHLPLFGALLWCGSEVCLVLWMLLATMEGKRTVGRLSEEQQAALFRWATVEVGEGCADGQLSV